MVDEIINSAEAQNDAARVARIQRKNAMFTSMSDTFKFMGGVLMTVAMAMIVPAIVTAAAAPGATLIGAITGLTATAPIGLALLGVATVITGAAVASQYMGSRGYQSGLFNSLEVNAKHTAKYLVKEIEGHNMCMTENKGRADGKTWCEYNAQRAAAEQQIVR